MLGWNYRMRMTYLISGISYLIQFPNKPKRESTSISGGEKTLAAIVFVLALQKLKPSPILLV